MKTIVISIFLILNIIFLKAQTTMFGITLDPISNTHYFVSINPDDASITQMDSIFGAEIIKNGTATMNQVSGYFIFATYNKFYNQIFTVDISTGNTISNPYLTAPVAELNYDKVSGDYYALEHEDTTTIAAGDQFYINDLGDTIYSGSGPFTQLFFKYYLVSVNATTGMVTRINDIPGVNGLSFNNSCYNPVSEEFTFIGDDDILYTINANTGSIISNPSLSTGISELQLNLKTGELFGIEYDEITNIKYLVTINPTSGLVSQINALPVISNFKSGTSTLDTLNNKFSIVDDNDNLINIDLSTGNISSNPQLSTSVNHLCVNTVSPPQGILNPNFGEAVAEDIISNGNQTYNLRNTSSNSEYSSFNDEEFKAYPNPVKNNLIISIMESPTLLKVYNINGTLVNTKTLTDNLNNIDVSDYQNGLYFFTLSNSTKTETKKISIH